MALVALVQRGLRVQSSSGSFCFLLRLLVVANVWPMGRVRFGHHGFGRRCGKQVCAAA